VSAVSTQKQSIEQSQRPTQLANEFTTGMTPNADPAAQQPEPIDKKIKATETEPPNSMEVEVTSDALVRLVLKTHLPHINRIAEWEKQWKMPHSEWEPGMEVLINCAKILQENELRAERIATQSQADIPVQSRNHRRRLSTLRN
jgi:hypothetical protein